MDNFDENILRIDTREGLGKHHKSRDVLTPKAKMACEYYLRGMSVRESLIKAGYSPTYVEGPVACMRFLKTRTVQIYLRKRQEELAEAESIDRSKLVRYAQHILADDDAKDRTKALELLMRMSIPNENIQKDDVKGITINIGSVDSPKEDNKI